jgi:hypothetical protein
MQNVLRDCSCSACERVLCCPAHHHHHHHHVTNQAILLPCWRLCLLNLTQLKLCKGLQDTHITCILYMQ